MVKSFLRARAGLAGGGGSRHAPVAEAGPEPSFRLLYRKAVEAGASEADANPRARSAKLRAAIRTDAPAVTDGPELYRSVVPLARLEAAL